MYFERTNDIHIEVEPSYVPEQSQPKRGLFFFSYKIKITNVGASSAQLISRHWIITDGNGVVHEVKGPGVVGYQPHLEPGQSFEYSSFCPLPTPTGNMRGTFQMLDQSQREFKVRIPLFFLRDLRSIH